MVFRSGAWAAVVVLGVMGCGSGLSEEDARVRCDQERDSKGSFVTDEAYDECVACYEECGDECTPMATAIASYVCPAEE